MNDIMTIYTRLDTGSRCKIIVPPRLVQFAFDIYNISAVRWHHIYRFPVPVVLTSTRRQSRDQLLCVKYIRGGCSQRSEVKPEKLGVLAGAPSVTR